VMEMGFKANSSHGIRHIVNHTATNSASQGSNSPHIIFLHRENTFFCAPLLNSCLPVLSKTKNNIFNAI